MKRYVVLIAMSLFLLLPAFPFLATAATTSVTLQKIMADPDWIGNPPVDVYWGYRGARVYYWQQRGGGPLRNLYSVDVKNSTVSKVPGRDLGSVSAPGGSYNFARTRKVFIRHNNVFVRNLQTGKLRELTRDTTPKADVSFMANGEEVQWHEGTDIYLYDLKTGGLSLVADIQLRDNPDAPKPPTNYLEVEQLHLFQFIRSEQVSRAAEQKQQDKQIKTNSTRMSEPWYLGHKIRVIRSSLSSDGNWLALVTIPASYKRGRKRILPVWITRSGYLTTSKQRTYVGRNPPPAQSVLMLNLVNHTSFPLNLTQLPGITDDPLAALRKSAVTWDIQHGIPEKIAEESVKAPAVRPVSVLGIKWSDNGQDVAFMFRANDNKDRWIATLDFANKSLITQNRFTDPAWNAFRFDAFGWMHDNHTLWYLSEATNYAQLYTKDINSGRVRKLTSGPFEVTNVALSRDDRYFFVVANKKAPGTYEIYRVGSRGGNMQEVTDLGGVNGPRISLDIEGSNARLVLSPNDNELLFYHSTTLRPPQVWIVAAQPNSKAKQITHTVSPAFSAINWIQPRIVKIPSTHVPQPIYARLWVPRDYMPTETWPAVVFIHGDGQLQNVMNGWSSFYFREAMFSSFLAEHGYIVISLDYRGSTGYGRVWREATYQHMGHPEVQDITDGVHWLEKNWHVSPAHVGVWGGSYGGFLTEMMMFRRPNLFQAGAALRPVEDWADYRDAYTSDILNRPNVDPEAYYVSSAINYAGRLKHHLLILQGLEDTNDFFLDTVRTVERLEELHNLNFDIMFYPMENHGFTDAYAWLDEYRRVWQMFEKYVALSGPITTREAN